MRYRYADGFEFEASNAREVCEALWHSMPFQFYDTLVEMLDSMRNGCAKTPSTSSAGTARPTAPIALKPMWKICCATACSLRFRHRPRLRNERHRYIAFAGKGNLGLNALGCLPPRQAENVQHVAPGQQSQRATPCGKSCPSQNSPSSRMVSGMKSATPWECAMGENTAMPSCISRAAACCAARGRTFRHGIGLQELLIPGVYTVRRGR